MLPTMLFENRVSPKEDLQVSSSEIIQGTTLRVSQVSQEWAVKFKHQERYLNKNPSFISHNLGVKDHQIFYV